MKKDIVIKIILLVLVVAVISSTLTSLVVTNTISGNKILGSVNYSDYLDSSNVTYSDSNVQDSIDNLYTQANDYSSINNRVNTLEGYFKNNPTSYFDGSRLRIGVGSSASENKGVYIHSSNVERGGFYYDATKDKTLLVSNSSGSSNIWGQGTLELVGNPVQINNKDVTNMVIPYVDRQSTSTYRIPISELKQNHLYGMAIVSAWKYLYALFYINDNSSGGVYISPITSNCPSVTVYYDSSTNEIILTWNNGQTIWDGISILPL